MSKYLINLDDGHLSFRNKYTDGQVNMKPVPDTIANMIVRGDLKASEVVSAINAKIRESGEFDDIEKYLSERAKLNVRKIHYELDEKKDELRDRTSEEISTEDIVKLRGKPAPTKKEIAAKAAAKQEKVTAKLDVAAEKALSELNI